MSEMTKSLPPLPKAITTLLETVGLRKILNINEQCVFVVCTTVNLALIWLLITERNREMRAYSRVLLQNSAIDIAFTLIISVTELQSEFVHGRLVIFINGPFRSLSTTLIYFQVFLWMSACCGTLITPPIIFYFRYQLIVKGELLSNMRIARLTIITLLCSLHQGATVTLSAYMNDKERERECADVVRLGIWRDFKNSACITTKPFNGLLIHMMVAAFIMETAAYGIMGYCTMTSMRHLNAIKSRLSMRTIRLQHHMNVMLVSQMVMLMVFGLLPVIGMVIFIIFGVSLPGAATVMTICVSWLPILNPLSTLIFVGRIPHRLRSILHSVSKLRCLYNTKSSANVYPNMSSSPWSRDRIVFR